jgi:hypothetical protein
MDQRFTEPAALSEVSNRNQSDLPDTLFNLYGHISGRSFV